MRQPPPLTATETPHIAVANTCVFDMRQLHLQQIPLTSSSTENDDKVDELGSVCQCLEHRQIGHQLVVLDHVSVHSNRQQYKQEIPDMAPCNSLVAANLIEKDRAA